VVNIISEDFNQVAAGWIGDLGGPVPATGRSLETPAIEYDTNTKGFTTQAESQLYSAGVV